jgi:hypothetical protein
MSSQSRVAHYIIKRMEDIYKPYANLFDRNLTDTNLTDVNLRGANLTMLQALCYPFRTNLTNADFIQCNYFTKKIIIKNKNKIFYFFIFYFNLQ